MKPDDALLLDNWFPGPSKVSIRKGYQSHATGMSGQIRSLMTWHGPTSEKMFAAETSAIYEVTSAGAVGAAEISSLTNGEWQQVMMATSGGNFLVICNGADAVRNYDGTTWTTPTLTGVTSADLIHVAQHKRRLFFVEKNSTSAWYLPVDSVSGTVTEFDLGPQFKLGGHLVAIGSMTRDGGAGPDDFAVFVSSRGEVAVYQGTDPATASTWAIVGVFQTAAPIGPRCLEKAGGDLALLTEDGVLSLSAMLVLDRAASERAAITSRINDLFLADARLYNANFGWQMLSYPRGAYVIVNVPSSVGATQHQWVMNAITGAWCRFTGLNASSWGILNENLYFGGNAGVVWRSDVGMQDNGGGITAELKTAFNDDPWGNRLKHYKMMRPIFETTGSPGFLMGLNLDYEDVTPTAALTAASSGSSVWDTAKWDVDAWGGATLVKDWQGAEGLGSTAALRLRVATNGASVALSGFELAVSQAGLL